MALSLPVVYHTVSWSRNAVGERLHLPLRDKIAVGAEARIFRRPLRSSPVVHSPSITPWHDRAFHHLVHEAIFGLFLHPRPFAPNRERTRAYGQQ